MTWTTRNLMAWTLAGCILALCIALPASTALSATVAQTDFWLHYDIDYSQVPSWVRIRDLTLKVRVGQAQSVEVIAGGQTISSSYDAATGWATFTTDAPQVDIRLVGLSSPLDQIGEVQKAVLRDDKRWAYSLTFDDGRISVWDHGKPMLDRLGYRAAVAVIGRWLDEDGLTYGYMPSEYLLAMLRSGWSLFNHSYRHAEPEAVRDYLFEDTLECNEAFARTILGYSPLVFTPAYNRVEFADAAEAHNDVLKFQVIQVGGGPIARVDTLDWSVSPYRLGRWDIFRPRDGSTTSGALYYMSVIQSNLAENPGGHFWLNLHSHEVSPNDIAGTSLDHVHFMYGPGGTDEVWVAPADEVFQYLATQNFTTVQRIDSRSVAEGYKPAQIRQVALRQGWNGYTGMTDASIDAAQPKVNFNGQTDMWVRTPDVNAALLRFDLSSIPTDAYVLRATLGVYVVNHSNQGDIAVEAYALRKAWDVNEVTWEQASAAAVWAQRGANATSGDDRDRDSVYTDRRSFRWYRYVDPFTKQETMLDDASWYSLDVTQAAREWIANPSLNLGVILKGSGGSVSVKMKTSENRDAHLRPCLVITYMEAEVPPAALHSPTPEPTATMTPTPTATATVTATVTVEPTYTATPSPTATATAAVSPSPTATVTPPHPPFQLALPVVLVNLPYPASH